MKELDQIINKIKEMNAVKPSVDLTPAIMYKISLITEPPYALIWKETLLLVRGMFEIPPTKEECVISFISMGVFYLIFGLMLLFFIKNATVNSEINSWLKLQSPVFILIAIWLTILGSTLWLMGEKAIRFAQLGLVIYILIFVVSAALMSSVGNIALFLGTALSIGAIIIGISLNISVGKYEFDSNLRRG